MRVKRIAGMVVLGFALAAAAASLFDLIKGGVDQPRFDQLVEELNAEDALTLAILHPWLAHGGWLEAIMASPGAARQAPPPGGRGPVTSLTVTKFSAGTTSFTFRVDWPAGMKIPWGRLELMGKLDLGAEEWTLLDNVDVEPAQGYKEFEIQYDEIIWYYLDMDFAQKAFFMLRPSEPEEEDGGGLSDKDSDDYDPPEIPTPVDAYQNVLSFGYFLASSPTPVSSSIPVQPGLTYMISIYCVDWAIMNNQPTHSETIYHWEINLPDGQVMSGGTDTQALWSSIPPGGNHQDYNLMDFRILHVPDSGSSAAGLLPALSPGTPTIETFSTVESTDPNGYPYGLINIRGSPINLTQSMVPTNAAGANPGSTDLGGSVPQVIHSNGVAFITGAPAAPLLDVRTDTEAARSFYRLEIESERTNASRVVTDYRQYPEDGSYFERPGWTNFNITQHLMKNEIVGGKCKLHYKIISNATGQEETGMFPFFIRGLNPSDAVAEAYIEEHVDEAFKPYAWSIFKHETRDGAYVYNQFNVRGKDFMHRPNYGYPDGWGICQIDRSGEIPKGTKTASTAEVYNWRTNVLSGNLVLLEKQGYYTTFTNYFRMTYPDCFVPPPPWTNPVNNVTWPAEQFAVTVFFNGADTNTIPKSAVWKGKLDSKGKPISETIYSPVVFYPKTQTWRFYDNIKQYANKVSQEFVPNAFPPPKE